MQHTLVAVFDNRNDARNAMNELTSSGFAHAHVHLSNADPSGQTDSISGAASPDDRAGHDSGIAASIRHFFLDLFGTDNSEHASRYEGMLTRGHHVLTVSADSMTEIERAADIIERYGPTDIDEHLGEPSPMELGAGEAQVEAAPPLADSSEIRRRPQPLEASTLDDPGDPSLLQQHSLNQDVPAGTTYQEHQGSSGLGATGSTRLHRSTLRDMRYDEEIDDISLQGMPPPSPVPGAGYMGASLQSDIGSGSATGSGSGTGSGSMAGSGIGADPSIQAGSAMGETGRSDSQQRGPAGTSNWSGTTPPSARPMGGFDDDAMLREQYDANFANSGMSYDAFGPAYRFGTEMARNSRYSRGDWSMAEADLRSQWESTYPDEASSWDRIKAAVRRGWESLTGDANDDYYRAHYDVNYADSGRDYEALKPAYVYGSEMRNMDAYRDRPWDDIESSLRTGWDSRIGSSGDEMSTWERVKQAVRHGWESLRDDDDETYYRDHWQAVYEQNGTSYEDTRAAYAYGAQMAREGHYDTRRWDEVEPALRQGWEREHRGAGQDWAAMRAAVRTGWERMAS